MNINCSLCGEPVDPLDRRTYRRATGWERKAGVRASGKHGGSDIRLRELLDEYAHPLCVDRAAGGINTHQFSFIE